jgi:hypothetical protein
LSEADRLILTQKRNKQLLLIPALAFASLVSLLLIAVIHTCFTTVFFLTIALSTAAKAMHSLASVISLNRDLSAGQKRLINAPVEDQNMDVSRSRGYGGSEGSASYVFWIKAGGYKIPVTEEQYYQIKKGDLVEAFLAPNSGTVFGVNDRSAGDAPLQTNALEEPPLSPPKPRSKLVRVLIWGSAVLVVLLIVLGVAGFVVVTMPVGKFNRLNPFTPKPPRGVFPASIAGFTLAHNPEYFLGGYYSLDKAFKSYYAKPDSQIEYQIVQFWSAEEAKVEFDRHKSNLNRICTPFIQQAGNRKVCVEQTSSATSTSSYTNQVVLTLGPQVVEIDGFRFNDVIDFENGLPYDAFGVRTPPPHSASEFSSLSSERSKRGETVFQNLRSRRKAEPLGVFGAALVLTIDQNEWQNLSKEQQIDLTYYIENLIPKAHVNPDTYIGLNRYDPLYPYMVRKAENLCDDCWEIGIGQRRKEDAAGAINYDHAVVMGDSVSKKTDLKLRGQSASEFRQQ